MWVHPAHAQQSELELDVHLLGVPCFPQSNSAMKPRDAISGKAACLGGARIGCGLSLTVY